MKPGRSTVEANPREGPSQELPIPDDRTFAGDTPARRRPDLLETIHLMWRRQAWTRDELIEAGAGSLPFVGRCRNTSSTEVVAMVTGSTECV